MSRYTGWWGEKCWICPTLATHTYNRHTNEGPKRTFVCEYHAGEVVKEGSHGKVTELDEYTKWRKRKNHPASASAPPPPPTLL